MKHTTLLFLCLVFQSFLPVSGQAQITKGAFDTKTIDTIVMRRAEADSLSGIVLIGSPEGVLYRRSVGMSNRTWNIDTAPNHRFDISSLNKSFIAALVLMAVEEGRLLLYEPVVLPGKRAVPGLSFPAGVTLHQTLTHTAGMPDYGNLGKEWKRDNFRKLKRLRLDPQAYSAFVMEAPRLFKPGKNFHYSNFGYHLTAMLLERAYGMDFGDLLNKKILGPLELRSTFSPVDNETIYPKVAQGYNFDKKTRTWRTNQFIDFSLGRRIFSTADDLYKWTMALENGKLLTAESKKRMFSNHLSGITDKISYGYGWAVFRQGDTYGMGNLSLPKDYVIHGGSTEGYRSLVVSVAGGELVFVLLANSGDRTKIMDTAKEILHSIYNITP
ncbi:hypothetical protein FUAX_07830 [Fulvitalea axinellae]|uniref:Beta-lactamase-related domain-containing protein n=1 Tax=Fulvitalea axinellae TaxID=1182444 RepID=A0AAU9D6A1_9BACT|nr:hypothetical protein FUAX_07830 [Fulvitalea axinellae]